MKIYVKGARTHNLKNIDVGIPKNQLVVITGLSGSGKSSLAFDTIYAEGQRRYVESLSAYARQFLDLMEKPDVDSIEGLSPAIAIQQKTIHNNPRSTVATITEIYDYLRLLYARVGIPYSPITGKPIQAFTVSQIVDQICKFPEKTKFMVLAPVIRNRKGEYKKLFESLQAQGFSRFKVNDQLYTAEDLPDFSAQHKHTISVVVDRLIKPHHDKLESWQRRLTQSVEVALRLGDSVLWVENIDDNQIQVFSTKYACPESGFSLGDLEPQLFSFNSPQGACEECAGIGFHFYGDICGGCQGKRLKNEALCVRVNEKNIIEFCQMSIEEAFDWVNNLFFSPEKQKISDKILKEIKNRISFLNSVGLGYLTLDRLAGTLSGGESQRIRLASQIGSQLTGILYVLDEPSIGLHQRDNDRLINMLKGLRDLGNTVIVVEHDEDTIRESDYIIDMGPHSGLQGGYITAEGNIKSIIKDKNSLTGQYLSGVKKIEVPKKRRVGNSQEVRIIGAKQHNLKNIDVSFPLNKFICVTGVSGSGKSSLVMGVLRSCLQKLPDKNYEKFIGGKQIERSIDITQTPIGRTPRSNPVTYTGVFTPIREWFASLPESKTRGYGPGRFSFNIKGGRCEACEGDGLIRVSMHFLPDVYTTCDSCKGKRFNLQTLEIQYKGKTINDVLNMTVDEGIVFFTHHPIISKKLQVLQQVGLGYIGLGQSATTLSGGEAQRVKLAKELSKRPKGQCIYILDEPTTGLHFEDIKKLLEILHTFIEQGHTVIVIEHNLEVIKTADWVIDLGPEGGQGGGQLVAIGTPEEVCKNKSSITGKYLKKLL